MNSDSVSNEIQLISDGDGLAVIGDPAAVERFMAAEGLTSNEFRLPSLNQIMSGVSTIVDATSSIAESASAIAESVSSIAARAVILYFGDAIATGLIDKLRDESEIDKSAE